MQLESNRGRGARNSLSIVTNNNIALKTLDLLVVTLTLTRKTAQCKAVQTMRPGLFFRV